jgi:hypothetical protein
MTDCDSLTYCAAGQEGIIYDRVAKCLLVLNPSARRVWELARRGDDVASIAASLCASYAGIEPAAAQRDVRACLAELHRRGILTGDTSRECGHLGDM